jgi:hypothetical protein
MDFHKQQRLWNRSEKTDQAIPALGDRYLDVGRGCPYRPILGVCAIQDHEDHVLPAQMIQTEADLKRLEPGLRILRTAILPSWRTTFTHTRTSHPCSMITLINCMNTWICATERNFEVRMVADQRQVPAPQAQLRIYAATLQESLSSPGRLTPS